MSLEDEAELRKLLRGHYTVPYWAHMPMGMLGVASGSPCRRPLELVRLLAAGAEKRRELQDDLPQRERDEQAKFAGCCAGRADARALLARQGAPTRRSRRAATRRAATRTPTSAAPRAAPRREARTAEAEAAAARPRRRRRRRRRRLRPSAAAASCRRSRLMVEHVPPGEKAVVFTQFGEAVPPAASCSGTASARPAPRGATRWARVRDALAAGRAVDVFRTHAACRAIVLEAGASAAGLTSRARSTRSSSTCSARRGSRRPGRVARIGQRAITTAWHLVASGSVDERLRDAADEGRALDADGVGEILWGR